MDHISIEERYFTYNKFLDGVSLQSIDITSSACDLSFNDGITAAYLLGKGIYPNIIIPTFGKIYNSPNIMYLSMQNGLKTALDGIKTDLIISIGGTFNFFPLDDIAHTIYDALTEDGEMIFGIYPQIYDDNGVDILAKLSRDNNIEISRKLLRWSDALQSSYRLYFPKLEICTLITDTSADEVKDLFNVNIVKRFLFTKSDEFDKFFTNLTDASRLYMFWQVMRGKK